MSDYFANAYALLIAVNKSAEPRAALPDVAKDVDALAALLTHPQRCGYDPANVKILKDENSARAGILSGLDWLSQKIQSDPSQNATAVLYFTGHGHTEDGAYYLIPCDINLKRIKSSALSATDFAADVLALQPKRLLVMLDCCHAAGMDAKALTDAFAGVAIPPGVFMGGQPGAGADGSAKGLEQLAVGAGRAVLSSSQNNEKSWLRKDRVMSIFTYHVIEALSGHAQPAQGATEVLVSDVMSHVHRQVPHSAQAQHGASQQPDFQVSGNFPVALILGGKGLGVGEQPPAPLAPLAPASGAGARVVGAGGVLVEGNNTGNINTGTQIINTQGGAFVGGNVHVGGDFVGRDKVVHNYNMAPPSTKNKYRASVMNVFIGDNKSPNSDRMGLPKIVEPVRLDVASPKTVNHLQEFDIAVAIKQIKSPHLEIDELENIVSAEGLIERKSSADFAKYRVEISSTDFTFSPTKLTFLLEIGKNSQIKWFKGIAQCTGNLSFHVIAFQVDDDIEVASTRVTLESKIVVERRSLILPDANVDAEVRLSVESRKLVDLLDGYFSMDDLEDVAFRMSIEWENLRGETKRAKARALVVYCENRSRLPELKRWIGKERPNLRNQL